jgi:hypothetical protein
LFDGFTVYAQVLGKPSIKVSLLLLLRFLPMCLLFLQFRNAGRVPPKYERWNLLLAWKKPTDFSCHKFRPALILSSPHLPPHAVVLLVSPSNFHLAQPCARWILNS